MKKIKFCLTTTDKLLSKMIRFWQGTEFSHSLTEFEDDRYETVLIYEAKGLNSNVINKAHFDGKVVYTFEAEVSEELHNQIVKYIFEDVGTPYAWKELFGFAVVAVLKLVGIKIKNPFPQSGKVCSSSSGELLVRFFGVTPDVDYDDMDLIWLSEKLLHHPDFKMTRG